MLNFLICYYAKNILFFFVLFNQSIYVYMEIRNVIRFKTPLGFVTGMYVSDGEIRKLIDSHIFDPWNYKLVLYGSPLIQEFKTDLGFFKSFLSKLTPYKLAVLQQDSRFTHILNYLSNERKK